ncbi:MAG TPA: SIS domain-containing protein [Bryobacteraceae bacterium]|jgi:glucosamine--fructose-6-phosphate aminotransferase (isomerizing)|nr:SIS domain-containing protein [Bryobacteraceae bacterium]
MSTMRDEIRQQPAAIERTLKAEWRHAEKLRAMFQKNPPRLIVLAARGTSDNAAQFGRYLLEITTGIPVSLAAPSVYTLYGAKVNLTGALVVAISQSGESTDTNMVMERAKEAGAVTIGITNEGESALARLADHTFLVRAGKEKSVAATKTYTGQLACLYLLAYALGAPIGQPDLDRLPAWSDAALKLEPEMNARAERYCFMRHAVCIGRGINYSNSFEFALKLMETCYVVAERFSSADLLHGPIAMLEALFPAFVFGAAGPSWKPIGELIVKLQELKAETLVITDRSNVEAKSLPGATVVMIPAALARKDPLPADIFTPIPYIIPAQFFAASLAQLKRLDPDKPRTLSKVTQTL